ncbi:DUF2793 domain-containing protein [Parasphingopyxis algicola]|uniref:DUF2793 domain-containing protein n=1 Tax=Parasphingopyxis algicola TaxID=2026624 RepID=UPI0015A0A7F4|nr:DUF2793 domain-containing protein [Parasphingopyxis algicola]QLC23664.1 DUF2793 domain-containing protein [Parasphingopyxis algicola]
MSDETARLGLPFIQPGQAQKELYHNEALALLDAAVHAAVESRGDDVPPATPSAGQSWIIGAAPTGDWSGRAHNLATWTASGWRFMAPVEGMRIWLRDIGVFSFWTGSAWRDGELIGEALVIQGKTVVGLQQSAISDVTGGSVLDGEARTAIAAILSALRAHGLIAT